MVTSEVLAAYADRNRVLDAYVHPRSPWDWLVNAQARRENLASARGRLDVLLRNQLGIYPLHRMSLRIVPEDDGGNFYYEYKVKVGDEGFILPQRVDRWEGLRVQRSRDNNRLVEIAEGVAPTLHLPDETQVLIHLRHRIPIDKPEADVQFDRLVGHWIPELSDEPRTITLPRGVQVQSSDDTSFPPPLLRDTLVLG